MDVGGEGWINKTLQCIYKFENTILQLYRSIKSGNNHLNMHQIHLDEMLNYFKTYSQGCIIILLFQYLYDIENTLY